VKSLILIGLEIVSHSSIGGIPPRRLLEAI